MNRVCFNIQYVIVLVCIEWNGMEKEHKKRFYFSVYVFLSFGAIRFGFIPLMLCRLYMGYFSTLPFKYKQQCHRTMALHAILMEFKPS